MAYYVFPTDLIQQVKRATRAEAGLSHYDPVQTSPQPLPSISETVASFDPSPADFRCKNCKGRLLRGIQSLLCIHCGSRNNVVRDPISFKDTFAYRWLLQSLHLDGSETVGPLSGKGEINRGQSTSKVEISLSELLDFKLTWPNEGNGEINASNKTQVERSYLSLIGIDLDNFFNESRPYVSTSPEEHPVTSNDVTTDIKGVATHENLSFFENVNLSRSAFQSSKFLDNDAFSGWEADFQSANSGKFAVSNLFGRSVDSAAPPGNYHEKLERPDSFAGPTLDISSKMGSILGLVKDSQNGRLKDDSAAVPSPSDWTSDSLWNNSNLEAYLINEQHVPILGLKDAQPKDKINNIDLSLHLDSVFGLGKDSKDGNQKDGLAISPSINDWTSDYPLNNLNKEASPQTEQLDATISVKDALPQGNMSNQPTSFDWFQVEQRKNNTNAPANNVTTGDQVPLDAWNDFTSSIRVQDFSGNAPIQHHNQNTAASAGTSPLNLLSSDSNLDEMDFGSFSQTDPFTSLSGKGRIPTEMNNIIFDRMVDAKSDMEGTGQPASSGNVPSASPQSQEDVELLLSQMHDLSFMLENNLSPTKM